MADKINIVPFTDIELLPIAEAGNSQKGENYLNDLKELNVGAGDDVFRADQQGIWLGASRFEDAPFRVSMQGDVTATSIVLTGGTFRFGKTSFSDTAHAGYYIGSDGIYFGAAGDTTKLKYNVSTGVFDFIGTISGRATATIAGAIDSVGHFIDSNLDTSAKNILGAFTFGASGAIQIGTYVNGASGDIRISPNGIVGRDSTGAYSFTIDATTGDATFSGDVTGSTITGSTLTTGTSGANVNITLSRFAVRTATTEVLYNELGSESGEMGINDTSGNNKLVIRYSATANAVRLNVNGTSTDFILQSQQDVYVVAPTGRTVYMTNLNLGGSGSNRLADVNTLKFNGSTPLAGNKIYYVANSSGGAVTRKLTFQDGILVSET